MSVIKPRTRGKHIVRYIARLDRENHELLCAYAQFLGEPVDYVLNQLVECVLAKDKEFVSWRAEHSQSFVPRPEGRANRTRGRRSRSDAAHEMRGANSVTSTETAASELSARPQ